MNQPKFKFGDVVVMNGEVFEIGIISYSYGSYFYGEEGATAKGRYSENKLTLYTPPKPKKLFAYTVEIRTTEGYLYKYEFLHPGTPCPQGWVRAPKYDITYPEVKV